MGKDLDRPTKFFVWDALAAATEPLLSYCLLFNLVLYTRIVSCVLLRSGLGSPTDIGVVREATGIKAFFIIPSSMFIVHSRNTHPVLARGVGLWDKT